ncbi:D-alanyl-D-alanine carboxypeptidase [Streptomyces sp. NPDC058371]|uniref:D-alanyl-D-alanine carboxypeptidase n=1 Tax=Streptomyces sp. NPDC058371 TaxID=3346463 RepID=UPI0036660B23
MAVARERAATVRVDQATAVFSTRALKEAERTGDAPQEPAESVAPAEAEAEVEDVPAGSGVSSPPGAGGSSGDARLRAAVAAWVATADDSDGPEDAGSAGAEGSGAGSAEAEGLDGDAAEAVGPAEAEGSAEGSDGSDSDGGLDVTDGSDSAGGSDVTDGSDSDGGSDVTEGSDSDGGSDASVESGSSVKDSAAGAVTGDEAAPEAGDSAEGSEDAPGSEADAPAEGSVGGTAAEGDAPAKDSAEDAPAPEADAPGKGSTGDTAAKTEAPANADAPAKGSEDGVPAPESEEAAKGPDEGAAKPPVDQPTAVFKAVRTPAVDQPTTMLKLGGAAKAADTPAPADDKPGAKQDQQPKQDQRPKPNEQPKQNQQPKPNEQPKQDQRPKSDAPAKPDDKATPAPRPVAESPAERTSKFVALKPLDEPGAAKPAAQAPAPAGAPASAPAPARPTVAPAEATASVPQVGPERTTQQPLPPRPPLDLLAELTNTPPPPETPVRTIVRRVKIWTPLVLLLAVVFAVVQAVRPLPSPSLGLTADETYTFKGGKLDLPWPGQGQSAIEVEGVGSLGTDGKQTAAPIASVAKIMTAYVILQGHPLKGNEGGPQITVDQQAEDESKLPDESTAAMTKGQKFTERQMLQMLMIPSGNNAARLLARWDSDNKTFVGKMNAAAKELGMSKSTYTDPSGLQKTTVSTASDQIKLAKNVMQDEVFRSIVGMASAKIPGLDKPIYNNNDLLVQQVGVIGLKTGSSTPAGGNLVWAATKTVGGKTQTIYGAVMGQNAGTGKVWDSLHLALTNSQKLIDKVQQSLTTATVVKKGDVVGYVDDRLGGRTPVVATQNMTAVGWPGLTTKLSIGQQGKTAVPHSGEAGKVVGELTVGDGSHHAVKIPVALRSDLAEPGFGAKLTRVS